MRLPRSRAREEHPLHECLPVLVEIAGQPQSDAIVAGLAARCASCVAVLDPAASAGALGLVANSGPLGAILSAGHGRVRRCADLIAKSGALLAHSVALGSWMPIGLGGLADGMPDACTCRCAASIAQMSREASLTVLEQSQDRGRTPQRGSSVDVGNGWE